MSLVQDELYPINVANNSLKNAKQFNAEYNNLFIQKIEEKNENKKKDKTYRFKLIYIDKK